MELELRERISMRKKNKIWSNSIKAIIYCIFPGGAIGKEPTCQCRRHEMWAQSLGQEDPLEEDMATCSSIPAWRIPWTVYSPWGHKDSDATDFHFDIWHLAGWLKKQKMITPIYLAPGQIKVRWELKEGGDMMFPAHPKFPPCFSNLFLQISNRFF